MTDKDILETLLIFIDTCPFYAFVVWYSEVTAKYFREGFKSRDCFTLMSRILDFMESLNMLSLI